MSKPVEAPNSEEGLQMSGVVPVRALGLVLSLAITGCDNMEALVLSGDASTEPARGTAGGGGNHDQEAAGGAGAELASGGGGDAGCPGCGGADSVGGGGGSGDEEQAPPLTEPSCRGWFWSQPAPITELRAFTRTSSTDLW